jgi:3-oxoacyl-[acyl-carrier protein] reductase
MRRPYRVPTIVTMGLSSSLLSRDQRPLGVLVTGASSGIGQAIAIAAARAGADVALTYARNEPGARETAHAIQAVGRRATIFRLDFTETGGVEQALAKVADGAQAALGRVDVWINNAGADILTGEGSHLSDEAKLDRLIAVDLRGTVLASWRAAAVLGADEGGGTIINMSWDHVLTGMAGRNPQMFSAVKGGVLSFSKSLARSVAPRVRVNVIAPGWIDTAFGSGLDPQRRREVAASTPLGRWGTPADVAAAAVYLASPAAAFLTGQIIFVNGGVVMG